MSSVQDNRETFAIRALMQQLTLGNDDSGQNTSMLLVLPSEIRENIYSFLHEDIDLVADVTMTPPRSRRGRSMRFQHFFPDLITIFEPLLNVAVLREEIQEYIANKVLFVGQHSSGFTDMPVVFGAENCQSIRRFEMRVEFQFKVKHQGQWPDFLKCFVEDLPNLNWLKLYSRFNDRSRPHPENESKDPEGSMSRLDQDIRSTFRFLSWLNLRHPNFQDKGRLILPAESGGRFGQREVYTQYMLLETYRARRAWQSKTKFVGPKPPEDEEDTRETRTVYDEVLNTKLGRRLPWAQFQNGGVNLNNLIIHPVEGGSRNTIVTSEVGDEDDEYFRRLDERGYQLYELFEAKGWLRTGAVNVEGIIVQANRFKQLSIVRAQREADNMARGGGHVRSAGRGADQEVGRGANRGRGRGRGLAQGEVQGDGYGGGRGRGRGGFRGNG